MTRRLLVPASLAFLMSSASASPVCATLYGQWSGTVQLTTVATPAAGPSACQYVYFTGQDYAVYSTSGNSGTSSGTASVSLPSSAELAQAFEVGFILPMAGFVIAYLVGRLVAMFNPDHG